MKKLISLLLTILAINSCKEKATKKSNINLALKEKLENILTLDQGIRKLIQKNDLSETKKDSLINTLNIPKEVVEKDIYALMNKIDSINLIEVENIIEEFGYPAKELVGEPANEAVFYVIQHSSKIEQYLPIIKEAANNGDISMRKLAMMEDRHLMQKGKEQIYGTQIYGEEDVNGNFIYFVWPIQKPDSVNSLRKKIGLESIEVYAKKFDIDYKPLTLKEVVKLRLKNE